MKKVSVLVAMLFLLPRLSWAQPAVEILVFSAEGDIKISRNKTMIPCKRAEKILPVDIINLKKGTVTLVDRNLKRVSLEKKGKYSYMQIVKQFSFANASLENRFLILVLDKMNHKTEPVSYGGGVVRGTPNTMLPMDSVIILSDSIRFVFSNPRKLKFTFFLSDEEHHILFSKEITDSLLVLKKQNAGWWKPGAYFWEAGTGNVQGTAEKTFFIPQNDDRAGFINDYYRLKNAFPAFSLKTRNQLIDEILTLNRWVIY